MGNSHPLKLSEIALMWQDADFRFPDYSLQSCIWTFFPLNLYKKHQDVTLKEQYVQ